MAVLLHGNRIGSAPVFISNILPNDRLSPIRNGNGFNPFLISSILPDRIVQQLTHNGVVVSWKLGTLPTELSNAFVEHNFLFGVYRIFQIQRMDRVPANRAQDDRQPQQQSTDSLI